MKSWKSLVWRRRARTADARWRRWANGGSAAAASHWVCDFGKGINIGGDPKRLKIFAPSDHSSIFTAYGNDNAYDQTMVEQLKNFLEEG